MSLADEPGALGVHARVAEVFAAVDERRRAYLSELVKRGGSCRRCGAGVGDALLELHPGVCATCTRRHGVKPDPELLARLDEIRGPPPAPAAPVVVKAFRPAPHVEVEKHAEEEAIPKGIRAGGPCKGCGTKSTRCKADCPSKGKAAAPRKVWRVESEDLDHSTDELLARREQLLDEIAAIESLLRARVEAEEERLRRLREAVRQVTREVATAGGV